MSIDPPPSPTTPTFASSSLHYEPTVTGKDFLRDDRVTINDYMVVTKTAYQNSKELLEDVEHQKAELAAEQGQQLGLEASSYTRLLNSLRLSYRSNSINADQFSAPTASVNSTGTTLNTASSNSSNIDAVNTYNQAVTDFNAAQIAFDASPQSQSDIDTYNAAVNTFNAASTSYNSSITSLNSSITDYNAAVDSYNAEVAISNQDIVPPLTPRPELVPANTMTTGPTLTTYPPGNTTPPTSATLPAQVDDQLIDYADTSFGDILDQSGFISAKDAFKNFQERTTDYQNYTTTDLKEKPQKQQKNVTQPDAYTTPEDHTAPSSAGPGSAALASAGDTGGEQKILSVLTKIQIKNIMNSFNLPPDNLGVEQSTLALTSGFFASSIPSVGELNNFSQNSIVSAVATLTAAVAQSKSGTIDASVTSYVQNAEEFKNLNNGDKQLLAEALTAAIKIGVLTLGAAGLATQVGDASTLTPAFTEAKIQANPELAQQQFPQVQQAFDEAKRTFGEENVAATAGKLATEELTKSGVNSQTAFNIGTAAGNSLVQNGIGSNQQELVALIQTAAKGANGGEEIPDEQALKLARAFLLLGLGSAFQLSAEQNLIQKVEPETAAQLVEQSAIRLFGFSANFSQATIQRRQDEPKEELSFSRELDSQVQKLRETGDKQVTEETQKQLDNFTKTVDDLGAFLTDQFMDPGNTFQGLMYGSRGTEFKRGATDINVG